MTADDVRKRVDAIRELAGDDERAHAEEDRLWADVLTAIAERRCLLPAAVAREALKTKEIDFRRWCA
jgi:hypothetical protein